MRMNASVAIQVLPNVQNEEIVHKSSQKKLAAHKKMSHPDGWLAVYSEQFIQQLFLSLFH